MNHFVTGFLFDKSYERVALVQKITPEWMSGMLTGVGGKVEPGESTYQAMERETLEELQGLSFQWVHFCSLKGEKNRDGKPFQVDCFFATCNSPAALCSLPHSYKTNTGVVELIKIVSVLELVHHNCWNIVPNLRWLLPMAVSMGQDTTVKVFQVSETYWGVV